MSLEQDEPAAKRARIEEPTPATPSIPPPSLISNFFAASSTGLFGVLAPSLGKRAATEEEVGVTQYVSAEVEPFSGIIKHRFVPSELHPTRRTRGKLTFELRRFTDFLVYEVGLDGEVVRLKDIDGPQGKKREKGKGKAEGAKEPAKEAVPAVEGAVEATAPPAPAVEATAAPVEEKKVEEPVRLFFFFPFLSSLC
jgi:tRNA pseudouridine13 synthase